MKFLADMGISPDTVAMLSAEGYNAIHLQEQGLERLIDSDILIKAAREKRILLTHDLGFGELMTLSGANLPSVIIFRLRNMRPEHVNGYLLQIMKLHQQSLIEGIIISVTEGQIRLRTLPVSNP